jgi:universal stress protein A
MKTKPGRGNGNCIEDWRQAEEERFSEVLTIRRVLVPVDFSSCSCRALRYALSVGLKFDARLVLLHVVEPSAGGSHLAAPFGQRDGHAVEEARERLTSFCRSRIHPGTSYEVLVRIGLAHSEIADTAKALDCDLIVMGTRGADGNVSTLGSTADWVVHHASCPVLTLRPC